MPLVDKEPSWAERRVVLLTSSVLQRRRDRQRAERAKCSESMVVKWGEGGYTVEAERQRQKISEMRK